MAVGDADTETTERSIWALTVAVALPLLLPGTGSLSLAPIEALRVFAPAAPGVTVRVVVAERPEAWVAQVQVTVLTVLLQEPPPVALAETKVAPTGSEAGRGAVAAVEPR